MIPAKNAQVLLRRFTAAEAVQGNSLNVHFGNVMPFDAEGRVAHIRALTFAFHANITTILNPAAYAARNLRGLIQNITLRDVTGHHYVNGLTGFDLLDDNFLYDNFAQSSIPTMHIGSDATSTNEMFQSISRDFGVQPNEPAGTRTYPAGLRWMFTRKLGNPFEGLIPVVALTQPGSNDIALTFRLGTGLPGAPVGSTLVSYIDSTMPGLANVGLSVWAEVVYLEREDMVIDAPWRVDTYQIAEQQSTALRPESLTEYFAVRQTIFDLGEGATNNISYLTADIDGTQIINDTREELANRTLLLASSLDGTFIRNRRASQDLPMFADPTLDNFQPPILILPIVWGASRAAAAQGRINFRLTTTNASTRFIHRTVGVRSDARRDAILKAANCGCGRIAYTSGDQAGRYAPIVVKAQQK